MNPARREPLLWLQLLGLAAVPLEALLLLLVLAGADPGPFPGFERLLAWSLGSLAIAVLFWRLPPDLWSLLLVQVPLRGRRPEQLRLSALQRAMPLKLLAASGAALLLPLFWWADAHAGIAWAWSPLSASPRLVVLLVSLPILALMQWQWHQLVNALWMLSRPASLVDQTLPLTQAQAGDERLNLGLPLLLLAPLQADERPAVAQAPEPSPKPEPEPTPEPETQTETETEPSSSLEAAAEPAQEPNPEPSAVDEAAATAEPEPPAEPEREPAVEAETAAEAAPPAEGSSETSAVEAVVVDTGVAVTPEQAAEEHEGPELDPKVAEGDGLPG